jgi:hypothetical protein
MRATTNLQNLQIFCFDGFVGAFSGEFEKIGGADAAPLNGQ